MTSPRLTVHQLGSGSSGNATLVCGAEGALIVDAGFSAREIARRAEECGVPACDFQAVLLTHAHGDHCKGAPVLARRHGIPIWGTRPTLTRLYDLRGREQLCELPRRGAMRIAGLRCETLPVSHDAAGTIILKLEGRIGIATDFGIADARVRRFLSGLEMLLLEFNHDRRTLLNGPYPRSLQNRILSDQGHLSNAQAVALLTARDFVPPSKALVLCHLSHENNRPNLALAAARRAMRARPTQIVMTDQDEPAAPLILEPRVQVTAHGQLSLNFRRR